MAVPGGYQRIIQQDFSGGMYRNSPPDRIPANGAFDLVNCVLDLAGGVARRGGSVYRSTAAFGAGLRWIWDGFLSTGHVTLVASTAAFGRLESNGSVTSLGEGGLAAPVRPAVFAGKMFFPGGKTYDGTSWGTAAKTGGPVTIAANRLLVASGSRIYFSKVGDPTTFGANDFHEIPGGVEILGLEGSRDSCVAFTTGGIWVIGNLALELVDAVGNVQHRLDHYSEDILLWGDAGIAAWEGALIVPGIDAVWLINRGVTSELVGSFVRISDSIRDLYRGYVADGYAPGRATVINNHYLLPIIGAGKVVDMLCCRLDLMPVKGQPRGAWTRQSGYSARCAALATRVSATGARQPELLGAVYDSTARALTLSWHNPAQTTRLEADGSTAEWVWQTGAIGTGKLTPNLISKIRLRYQLSDSQGSPAIAASVAADVPPVGTSTWGSFIWGVGTWASPGTALYEALAAQAPEDATGANPFVWLIRRKRRFVSLRFVCKSPSAQLAIKTLEVFVRADGRI